MMKRLPIMRFRDLRVGDLFHLLTGSVRNAPTYKKVSSRGYIRANKKFVAKMLTNQKMLARIHGRPIPTVIAPERIKSLDEEVERVRRTK